MLRLSVSLYPRRSVGFDQELNALNQSQMTRSGTVYLVGAGPGDPELITTRGLELLRQADVVAYDALVARQLLTEAPTDAELIDVGKRARAHKVSQDKIHELLAEKALMGKTVVRLKGGDPYLFGRGAEEVEYLARRGITCYVVPGVTAGIAAPMMAGVPVTHRDLASTVTFVTGHEDPTKGQSAVDYASLAGLIRAGGTVCFYMGVGRLGQISDVLINDGLAKQTPVALVQWGTTARQRSVRTCLATAVRDVAEAGIKAPAIIVVGPVAGIDAPGLDFFTRRPLFGQRVVVTRTRHQVSDLRRKLDALGATTFEAPTIELVEPEDWSKVDKAIQQLNSYDWLVLTSVNGVEALAKRMATLGLDSRYLSGKGRLKIAAIGDATADALWQRFRVRADLIPTRFVAESLAGELIAQHGVSGKRILMLRADIAREALPKLLTEAGAVVDERVAYQTCMPESLPAEVITALDQGEVDWVTFTSSSTVTNMIALLGEQRGVLRRLRTASIGPITSQTMRDHGLEPTVEAQTSNITGLVEVIVQYMDDSLNGSTSAAESTVPASQVLRSGRESDGEQT